MPNVRKKRVNETKSRVLFSHKEIEALLKERALQLSEIEMGAGVSIEVRFEDETEGSPAYVVGKRAIVEVSVDHDHVPELRE